MTKLIEAVSRAISPQFMGVKDESDERCECEDCEIWRKKAKAALSVVLTSLREPWSDKMWAVARETEANHGNCGGVWHAVLSQWEKENA